MGGASWIAAWAELPTYARFARGLRPFLGNTWTPSSAAAAVRGRLAAREAHLLATFRRALAGPADGVYPRLFAHAGVEAGELPGLVRREGVEGALESLRRAGVHVTFEEFKGRRPIRRGSLEIANPPTAFDDPLRRADYVAQSGGTTGAPTRVGARLEHLAAQAANDLLAHQAHGTLGAPTAVWLDPFPDGSGVNCVLRLAAMDQMPRRWLSTMRAARLVPPLTSRLANRLLHDVSRFAGRPLPRLEGLAIEQAGELARWAAETARREGRCIVCTHVSKALRIALAAADRGLDLSGVTFWSGGEPPTPAKVRPILATGARFLPGYWLREAGVVGQGCARPFGFNDIHLNRDAFGVVAEARPAPLSGAEVSVLLFTSLLGSAPKLMINVDCDDFGILERRDCGCALGELGLGVHVREVGALSKVTGEGVTLLGSQFSHLLEELLPATCGGSPLDYQLVEREGTSGFTELVVVVSPEVELADERRVVDTVTAELRDGAWSMRLAGTALDRAGAVTVRRARPLLSPAGKQLPLLVAPAGHDPFAAPAPPDHGAQR